MAGKLNRRLRRVDRRIAKIDRRRTDALEGRLYFQAEPESANTWEEVSIFTFRDDGITERKLETGEAITGRRFRIEVDRGWMEAHDGERGRWAVLRNEFDELLECDRESEMHQDRDTHAILVFRVMQIVSYTGETEIL